MWMCSEIRLLRKVGQITKLHADALSESREGLTAERNLSVLYPAACTDTKLTSDQPVQLSFSLSVSLYQTVTTVAIPGAAAVAAWASRATTAACWGAGTRPTAPPRAPPTAGFTLTTDWWAELSIAGCTNTEQVVILSFQGVTPQIKCSLQTKGKITDPE